MTKPADLRSKSAPELEALAQELRTKLSEMQFELRDKKLKNNAQRGETKRELARILTLLQEKK